MDIALTDSPEFLSYKQQLDLLKLEKIHHDIFVNDKLDFVGVGVNGGDELEEDEDKLYEMYLRNKERMGTIPEELLTENPRVDPTNKYYTPEQIYSEGKVPDY